MKRSSFIKLIAVGALSSPLAIIQGCAASLPYLQARQKNNQLVVKKADFEETAVLLENPQSEKPIYLHQFQDGSYAAVLTRCTHRGCQVDAARDHLICPCHGSEFNYEGQVLDGPADKPLFQYKISDDTNNIYIQLPNQAKS